MLAIIPSKMVLLHRLILATFPNWFLFRHRVSDGPGVSHVALISVYSVSTESLFSLRCEHVAMFNHSATEWVMVSIKDIGEDQVIGNKTKIVSVLYSLDLKFLKKHIEYCKYSSVLKYKI